MFGYMHYLVCLRSHFNWSQWCVTTLLVCLRIFQNKWWTLSLLYEIYMYKQIMKKKTNCNVLCMFSLKISNLHCKLELDSLIMWLLANSVWNPDFCAISTNACTTATIYWPPAMWFIHYPHVYVPFKITPCFVLCTIPIFCWVFTLYIQNKLI